MRRIKILIPILLVCLCIESRAETPKSKTIRESRSESPKPFIGFGTINGTRVNARAKATTLSTVVFQFNKNKPVNIVEEINIANPKDGEPHLWLRVQVPEDISAWVHADFIAAPFIKKVQDAKGQPVIFNCAKVKANLLNVRSGPGQHFPILGKLPSASTVHLTGQRKEKWAELFAPANTTVYVAARFVTRKDKVQMTDLLLIGPTPEFDEMFPDQRFK